MKDKPSTLAIGWVYFLKPSIDIFAHSQDYDNKELVPEYLQSDYPLLLACWKVEIQQSLVRKDSETELHQLAEK